MSFQNPEPYDVDMNDRMMVGRLRGAASRGDARAKATLKPYDLARTAERAQAVEKDRAARRAAGDTVAAAIERSRAKREGRGAPAVGSLDAAEAGGLRFGAR